MPIILVKTLHQAQVQEQSPSQQQRANTHSLPERKGHQGLWRTLPAACLHAHRPLRVTLPTKHCANTAELSGHAGARAQQEAVTSEVQEAVFTNTTLKLHLHTFVHYLVEI